MRAPCWVLQLLLIAYLSTYGRSEEVLQRGSRSAAVHFPDDKISPDDTTSTGSWRFEQVNQLQSQQSVRISKSQKSDNETATLLKRDRKADPARESGGSGGSVQDIISGIVQLLGGKVNLNTATTSKPSVVPSGSMRLPPEVAPPRMAASVPHPSRINNRAPPRLNPPVPFEAIPLELANSGQSSASKPPISVKHPQLPFGISFRPPVWPSSFNPNSDQNVQRFPFPSGIPLPVQLVPPAISSRPWITSSTSSTSSTISDTSSTSSTTLASPSTTAPQSSSTSVTPTSDKSITFTAITSSVPLPAVTATITTSTAESVSLPLPTSESSDAEPTLQPSIEDTTSATHPEVSPVVTMYSIPPTSSVSSTTATSWGVKPSRPFHPDSSAVVTSRTPPLPYGRPGQVFNDDTSEPHVITRDDFLAHHGGAGETFELVVTAAQNFGGQRPPPPIQSGRPHVIPVDIDHIRGGGNAPTGDDFVSIDTRKTYFNLFPTNVGPSTPVVVPTATIPSHGSQSGGYGSYGINHGHGQIIRPTNTRIPAPSYQIPGSVSSSVYHVPPPTPSLVRRPPTTTPIGRIDACIVGDPNACLEPNEACRADIDGSACTCKPGFGRRKNSDVCQPLAGFVVLIRLDKREDQPLTWSQTYTNPSSNNYLQLEWESNEAMNSLIESTPLASKFVSTAVNKFYSIGNKLMANVTVFMEHSPTTLAVTLRPQMMKLLGDAIKQRNNQLGNSPLWVQGPGNPIPLIQDLNECESSDLNDCSDDAKCLNAPGTYSCHCRPGFSDPHAEDLRLSGRQCKTCTRSHCHNRGECHIENGRKTCRCQGNYKGQQCELDGEVLGVAVGASVAAVFIIILTLVLLCMWSRRWRQTQEKIERSAYANGSHHMKHIPMPAMMHDRIRWAQYAHAEALAASQNLYAQPFCDYPYATGPSTLSSLPPPLHPPPPPPPPNVPPPPVPQENDKNSIRQTTSLPISLAASSLTNHVVGAYHGIQQLARKISRKKRKTGGHKQPDPVNVNPHLALISPAYPVGTMNSMGRASLAPTLPLAPYPKPRSIAGSSIHSLTGKRNVAPPPPSRPPPRDIHSSDDSAEESDVTVERNFHVPRPRSRSSRSSMLSQNNIYFEAEFPSNDFSNQSQHSMNQLRYHQQARNPVAAGRYYYR